MKSQKRFQLAAGASSLLLLSSCHPWLASKGETHSPYQPKTQQQQQLNQNGNGAAHSGSTAPTSPSSPATPATGATGPTSPASSPSIRDNPLENIKKVRF